MQEGAGTGRNQRSFFRAQLAPDHRRASTVMLDLTVGNQRISHSSRPDEVHVELNGHHVMPRW